MIFGISVSPDICVLVLAMTVCSARESKHSKRLPPYSLRIAVVGCVVFIVVFFVVAFVFLLLLLLFLVRLLSKDDIGTSRVCV